MIKQQERRFAAFLTFVALLGALGLVALVARFASNELLAISGMVLVIFGFAARAL